MAIDSKVDTEKKTVKNIFKTVLGAFVVLAVIITFNPIRSVSNGHRGVVSVFGKVSDVVLNPGLNLVNPLASIKEIETRIQKANLKGEAASKDIQSVHTTLTVNYHLNPEMVNVLYRDIGMDYEQKLLVGLGQDTFKATTSKYTAEELISRREEVRTQILLEFQKKVSHISNNTIQVDDVFINQFEFSPVFSAAIEAKQEAEQLAKKAERDLQRIKLEAEQKVVLAQAEAAGLKVQRQEITQDLIRLREIETQREAIRKWDGKLPTYSGGGAVPFLQIK